MSTKKLIAALDASDCPKVETILNRGRITSIRVVNLLRMYEWNLSMPMWIMIATKFSQYLIRENCDSNVLFTLFCMGNLDRFLELWTVVPEDVKILSRESNRSFLTFLAETQWIGVISLGKLKWVINNFPADPERYYDEVYKRLLRDGAIRQVLRLYHRGARFSNLCEIHNFSLRYRCNRFFHLLLDREFRTLKQEEKMIITVYAAIHGDIGCLISLFQRQILLADNSFEGDRFQYFLNNVDNCRAFAALDFYYIPPDTDIELVDRYQQLANTVSPREKRLLRYQIYFRPSLVDKLLWCLE